MMYNCVNKLSQLAIHSHQGTKTVTKGKKQVAVRDMSPLSYDDIKGILGSNSSKIKEINKEINNIVGDLKEKIKTAIILKTEDSMKEL